MSLHKKKTIYESMDYINQWIYDCGDQWLSSELAFKPSTEFNEQCLASITSQ